MSPPDRMTLESIGTFLASSKYPFEARRQASADTFNGFGEIQLHPGRGFEQGLEDLEGFERIWIVYHFHHNLDWKPKVMPPRGPRRKRGVFATRAPYRPNPLGLSCVRLVKIEGLRVVVEGHDLLDGTPVVDIKPYLPYADSFPESKVGWLESVESERWRVCLTNQAMEEVAWLSERGVTQLNGFIQGQLEFEPLDHKRKRVAAGPAGYQLSYRTWRIEFKVMPDTREIEVSEIRSGYSNADLKMSADPYHDKSLHLEFLNRKS